ncbi:PIN/TRAM domain-containing protein [Prochlorococcus sp. MIT 1223]|uniref:PIN/TRAM domain-containing protein n=1 Tax=Prochlorococcus sp. MIT 1223 TaxID=3096217 RepID=UPI002A75B9A6|nr:TRAM domain-containing protein [Prochlorococcus sp. MIT 1223]
MVDLLVLILFLIAGAAIGWFGNEFLPGKILEMDISSKFPREVASSLAALISTLIGFLFLQLRKSLIRQVRTMPTDLLISRSVGIIMGLLVANLLLAPILLLPIPDKIFFAKPLSAILSNIFFGLIGYNLADIHGRTLLRIFNPNSTEALLVAEGILTPATAKILDTSVIIDGRIKYLISCGLVEGQIIVAEAVIEELQKLADSSNNEKRGKGRRGLKTLTELREVYGRRLVVNSTKYEGPGADEILLKLTEDTGGVLITADFNLSKVAEVKAIKSLNLSDLVISLRPDVQPGAHLNLKIVREGKEATQGIGYLEDGTMVVIEGAKDLIGQRLEVVITGALQTPTGRMIFGKLEKNPATK